MDRIAKEACRARFPLLRADDRARIGSGWLTEAGRRSDVAIHGREGGRRARTFAHACELRRELRSASACEARCPDWKGEIGRAIDVAVRSPIDRTALFSSIKAQVSAVDPEVALSHVRTLAEATSLSIAPRVLNLSLVGGFSIVALLLSLVGVYGVMSYSVASRRASAKSVCGWRWVRLRAWC